MADMDEFSDVTFNAELLCGVAAEAGAAATVTATPFAVAVAACDITTVVASVTEEMTVLAGIPAPEIDLPAS
jgi:hypothetical protein